MKWFRHFSDAHTNEGLRKLRSTMGNEGVGIWWTVLEIIAAKMDESDRCHATYSVQDWCSFLGLKQKKLSLFLVLTEFELGLKSVRTQNELRIECCKLLELRDEWTQRRRRDSGVTPAQSQSQSQSQNQTKPPLPTPPVAQNGAGRFGGEGGGLDAFGPEVGGVGKITNPVRSIASELGITFDVQTPQDKAAELAKRKAETARVVAEARERYRAEREAENKHLSEKQEHDAVTWADQFAELVPACNDTDKAQIFTAIKKLKNHDQLQNMLEDIRNGIEAGAVKSPKGVILYRLKQA